MKQRNKIKLATVAVFLVYVYYTAATGAIDLDLGNLGLGATAILLLAFSIVFFFLSRFIDERYDESGQIK